MKNRFNFIQFTNWLLVCRENIIKIRDQVLNYELTKEEAIEKLSTEKRKISILRDVLDKKAILHGVQPDFLKKLKEIKKHYGIEN
jgi:hypothetical protein